jgi:hypothetical protein
MPRTFCKRTRYRTEAFMPEVKSSAIERIYYSTRRSELFVVFNSGRVYVYFGVPSSEYRQFLEADSLGAYFNRHIRDQYRCQELKPEPDAPDRT